MSVLRFFTFHDDDDAPLTILPPREEEEEACRQLQLFTCRHRPKRSCLDQSTDLTVGGPVNNYRVVVVKSLSWREWEGCALMAIQDTECFSQTHSASVQ